MRIALIALATNLVLSIDLAGYLSQSGFAGPHVGLAAATSVAAILNAVLLYRGLHKDRVLLHSNGWPILVLRIALATMLMGAVLYQLQHPLQWWIAAAFAERLLWLAISVAAGASTYFVALAVLGARLSQFRLKAPQ